MWNWGILGQSGLGPKQKFYFGLVLKLLFKLTSYIFTFILVWNCISSFSLHRHTHHHWSLLLRHVTVCRLLQPTTHPSFPISFSFSLPLSLHPTHQTHFSFPPSPATSHCQPTTPCPSVPLMAQPCWANDAHSCPHRDPHLHLQFFF